VSDVVIYTSDDGTTKIDLCLEDETIWLSQQRIAELFNTSKQNVSLHVKNIFESGELDENSVVKDILTTASDGKKYKTKHYNLDVVISVGYRVNSTQATHFRIWATNILKEYIIKGFTMDDERLKGSGGGDYWKELLERIRDIRSSEKALYRQVLDLYATSQDYNPKSDETISFFKTVQNKLHYATNEQTAPEVIYARADSSKDFMGLTTFQGAIPTLRESKIAKNYLTEEELFRLHRLVSAFFDLAELKAGDQIPMYMQDWVNELDKFAGIYGKGVLQNAGKVSRKQADTKAEQEFRTYEARTLSSVEEAYLESIKALEKTALHQLKVKKESRKK